MIKIVATLINENQNSNSPNDLTEIKFAAPRISSELDLDVETIIKDKIKKNGLKYPISDTNG